MVPIYAVAVVWLIFGLFLPLYRPLHYAAAAGASLAAFLIAKAIWPDRSFETPEAAKDSDPQAEVPPKAEEKKAPSTGNPELDALIQDRDRAVSEMRRLNDAIEDPTLSAQIDHLEEITKKIISYVVEHPQKLSQIRKFMNYYLPTTLKLLNAYDRMSGTGVSGENIDATLARVEGMMRTIVSAFEKQLDSLYGTEALDISTDITVLETMMAREGLTDQPLKADEPKEGTARPEL